MFILFFEVASAHLLFGFIPESLGLLLFGVGLIVFAVSMRRIFNRNETAQDDLKHVLMKNNR